MSTPGMDTRPAAPAGIRRRDRALREAGFEPLRALGIQLLQKTSGATWTDHNLHDPGITVLEALCFALTELVYRAEFPVADALTGPDGRIDFRTLSLHEPHEAFPCHATTAADYRRLLLDRVDGLDDARLRRVDGDPPGVHRLRLKLTSGWPASAPDRVQAALAAYRGERALGEDVAPQVDLVKDMPCEMHADIEVSGTQDAAELLALVYHRVAVHIDRSARLVSRRELRDRGMALEDIYDGPAVRRGFTPAGDAEDEPARTLYISELKRLVQAVPGVKEVHHLSLALPGGRRQPVGVPWGSDTAALRLRVPGGPPPADGTPPAGLHVQLRRRNLRIEVPPQELWRRVQDLQAAERAQRFRMADSTRQQEREDLPQGAWRPAQPYRSVQHHFPAAYGLGRHGVPAGAGPQALARMRQMRSYLILFEQVIANGQAQLEHLRELFSEAGARRRSRWWQLLGEAHVPGLEELMLAGPQDIEREVLAPLDRSAVRKSQLLDHLLALHGESFTQNAMRQFCGHLDAGELDRVLLSNKAAYLRQIVELSRKRGGGFDYGLPLWGHPGNGSAMARRVALLLGFRLAHARSLLAGIDEHRLLLDTAAQPDLADDPPPNALSELPLGAAPAGDASGIALAQALQRERGGRLPTALLRAGVAHDRWRLLRGSAADGPALSLLLRAEPAQRGWWRMGRVASAEEAAVLAAAWRRFLRKHNDGCEGLHLVEHVLLRPLADGAAAPAGTPGSAAQRPVDDPHALCVTAVMPDWTVRTQQPGFAEFARQTLRINCPAHLALGPVLWLDPQRMARFEAAYACWLEARRQHALLPDAARAQEADRAAAQVRAEMRIATRAPPSSPLQVDNDG